MTAGDEPGATGSPFDLEANTYDESFSHTRLGRLLRGRVHHRLAQCFSAGDRVLELGCGTGEDALFLARRGIRVLATDRSARMLELARAKVDAAELSPLVDFQRLDAEELDRLPVDASGAGFDGALADFGVVNCIADRPKLAAALADRLRPGARLVMVVMGPCCLWEIGWHLLHGDLRRATRRWRGGRPASLEHGGAVRVWYPTPRRLAAELAPTFVRPRCSAIGLALPSTDLARRASERRLALAVLGAMERWTASLPGAAWMSDHFLLIAERRSLGGPTRGAARALR